MPSADKPVGEIYTLFLDYAEIAVTLDDNGLHLLKVIGVDPQAYAFMQVFIADPGLTHILPVGFTVGIQNGFFPFHPSSDRVIVDRHPTQGPMYKDKGQAGQGGWYERACANHDPAENGAKHNGDDIIERRALAECSDARDADQGKGDKKADDGPTNHLQAVEISPLTENCVYPCHSQ
jgi:hypothetical protein